MLLLLFLFKPCGHLCQNTQVIVTACRDLQSRLWNLSVLIKYCLDKNWQYLCLTIFTIFAQSPAPGKAEHLLPTLTLDPMPHVWEGEVVPLPTLQLHSSLWRETLVQIHEGCRSQISQLSAGPLTTSIWYTLQVLSILATFLSPAKQQALSVLGKSNKCQQCRST